MRGLSLALFVPAAISLAAASATAAVVSIGSPRALECYERAEQRDDSSDALQTCTRALQDVLDVDNRAATHVNRGVVRMVRQDLVAADADFNTAIALAPSLADAWLNKGLLRIRTGDGDSALPFLERALELRPRRPALAYFGRGIAHEQAGNIRAAYADLTRARNLEPGWDLPAEALARYRVVGRTRLSSL